MKRLKYVSFVLLSAVILGCTKQVSDIERLSVTVSDTTLIKENIFIKTEDNINLSANYFYKNNKKEIKEPLVILIHQFRSVKEQWSSEYTGKLIKEGFKVLAYDIRGHGESDNVNVELRQLLSDGSQAPKDIDAVFLWAYGKKGIDSAKIGIIGTSIGASLGIYAKVRKGAGSVVAVSGGKGTFEAFTGYDDRMMSMGRPILMRKKKKQFSIITWATRKNCCYMIQTCTARI
jgi:dienelactone hydrolase